MYDGSPQTNLGLKGQDRVRTGVVIPLVCRGLKGPHVGKFLPSLFV